MLLVCTLYRKLTQFSCHLIEGKRKFYACRTATSKQAIFSLNWFSHPSGLIQVQPYIDLGFSLVLEWIWFSWSLHKQGYEQWLRNGQDAYIDTKTVSADHAYMHRTEKSSVLHTLNIIWMCFYKQDSLGQCPMPMKILALIRNTSQCGSLPINDNQFWSTWIDRQWLVLIGIGINEGILISIDRHWAMI